MDNRRGIGSKAGEPPESEQSAEILKINTGPWDLDYRTRTMRRPVRVDLTFLQNLNDGALLARAFWSRYGGTNYSGTTVSTAVRYLRRWAAFRADSGSVVAANTDILRAFMASNARDGYSRRRNSVAAGIVIECLAEAADLTTSGSGGPLRISKSELQLSCGGRSQVLAKAGRSFSDDLWQRLLITAHNEVVAVMNGIGVAEPPKSGTSLVPFMILIAAYTGANVTALLGFRRDAWKEDPVLAGYWRVTWSKDRAKGNEQQCLVLAGSTTEGLSAIDILKFVLRWTEPLVERVPESCKKDLWLHRSRRTGASSSGWNPVIFVNRHVDTWMRNHSLPATLDRIRPSAALTLLRSGKSITQVQAFLQHGELRTTWRYVRSEVLRPAYNRVITKTQERIMGLVIPKSRAEGVPDVTANATAQRSLASGHWDIGTCSCRDPYNSPIRGEIRGRLCRSFHACYFCPHAVWFKEHLPLEVWKLRRLESLRESDQNWEIKYGKSCEIIRRDILGSFSHEDQKWAETEAANLSSLPILVASGVTV
jgi:hypothetical protein